jgi:hypothetical protein
MKLTPLRVACDVADGLREALAKTAGVSNLEVTTSGSTITVKARVGTDSTSDVQGIIDDYKGSGFAIVYDRRINA